MFSKSGLPWIATVETMNFLTHCLICFIKILQPPLVKSRHNYSLHTSLQNKRRRWSPPPVPQPITSTEWLKFKDFLWILLSVTLGAGFIKFHQLFQKLLLMVEGAQCACFSFVVVLYSMYSLNAIIKVVLLDERDCHL